MRLEPKVFDVLAYLVRQRERVVAKDELLAQLWPGEFVSETVLPRCITAARKAVGDDPAGQKVIQTVHGRGYRFVASITDDAKRAPSDDSAIESVARLAEEIRQPVYSWFTTWWRGSRALCDGRFDEAERLRQQALAIGQRIQHPGAMAIAHGQSLWLASERGYAFEVFEAGFQFLLDYYPPAAIALRAGEAVYRAEAGDVGEARR